MTATGREAINDSPVPTSSVTDDPVIFPPMAKPSDRSILYRLIEAGQLTRKALLVPLLERGLEPGDDAVLFTLHDLGGATAVELAGAIGVEDAALAQRVARLIERDLLVRMAIGPELTPGLALTDRGDRLRQHLAEHWDELEAALLGELAPKRRRKLRRTLKRFVKLLRL
jgi:DNA-binding MarR family transcriptional regulator